MSGFHEQNGVLCLDSVPLSDIAKKYGTPAYVYSARVIRDQYDALAGALQKTLPANRQPLLCYACKANSNLGILKLLQSLGSSIEVVSGGELKRALKAGFAPEKIVMEGVGKTEEEILAGLRARVHQFNIESFGELDLINRLAGQEKQLADVVFRLNPDVGGAAYKKISTGSKGDKFGLAPERVLEGFARAQSMEHVRALGIFTHIGSQITETGSFEALFKKIADFVGLLRSKEYEVSRLDIGGGFPIQYQDEDLLDLDSYANALREHILPLDTEIIMEPGRYLVGNAGVLLTKVLYEKESYGEDFLVVDGAMNDLMRPALYGAWHGIEPVANRDAALHPYNIVGPVCESSDVFAKQRNLPEMKPGDLAVIRTAGAYGVCMASNYNTRPLPPEILVDGDKIALIRARQSYEDLLGADIIPDWLV